MTEQEKQDANQLYNEIDKCVTNLVDSRLSHSIVDENAAICHMESLMVKTQQFLKYLTENNNGR